LRQTSTVVYCAIDAFIPQRGKTQPGFQEFSVALDHAGVPAIWLTRRTRLQMDSPRRALGHDHPFIAEDGSGIYLPEDYFHLRPPKTTRLGRFTCIPIAEQQPAASEALEELSESTQVPVVSLRSLSPRELVQNSGLPAREAELARQRDFDELFFFAGASEQDIGRFVAEAQTRKYSLRQDGVLWSLAIGASISRSVRELGKLYDRALRAHAITLGIGYSVGYSGEKEGGLDELLRVCDRGVVLTPRDVEDSWLLSMRSSKARHFPLSDPDAWDRLAASITSKA
jgi:predicted mannosyl-3-phosphoglycerate phosphatase (HAD superfamily)